METLKNTLPRTGWPPGLLQDDNRGLFKWFASRPDARREVRIVADSIRSKYNDLQAQRRKYQQEVMREFDKEHYKKIGLLHEECGAIGHNFAFTDFGISYSVRWFHCTKCGKAKTENDDDI